MSRSIVGAIGLLIALMGIALFIAVGIKIWTVKAEVNRQAEVLSARANETLDSAGHAIGYVQDIIRHAKTDLARTRREMAEQPPQQPMEVSPLMRMTAENASQQLAGSVEHAHNAVVLASEAVVVADAALDVVGGVPELKKMLGVKPGQLDATRTALGKVSNELQKARDVLGIQGAGSQASPTNEQLYAVDDALHQAWDFTEEVVAVVRSARCRVEETKHQLDVWTWRAAVGTSIVSVFGLAGQLFMLRYFWQVMWRKPRVTAPEVARTPHSPSRQVA